MTDIYRNTNPVSFNSEDAMSSLKVALKELELERLEREETKQKRWTAAATIGTNLGSIAYKEHLHRRMLNERNPNYLKNLAAERAEIKTLKGKAPSKIFKGKKYEEWKETFDAAYTKDKGFQGWAERVLPGGEHGYTRVDGPIHPDPTINVVQPTTPTVNVSGGHDPNAANTLDPSVYNVSGGNVGGGTVTSGSGVVTGGGGSGGGTTVTSGPLAVTKKGDPIIGTTEPNTYGTGGGQNIVATDYTGGGTGVGTSYHTSQEEALAAYKEANTGVNKAIKNMRNKIYGTEPSSVGYVGADGETVIHASSGGPAEKIFTPTIDTDPSLIKDIIPKDDLITTATETVAPSTTSAASETTSAAGGGGGLSKAVGVAGTLYGAYNLTQNWDDMSETDRVLGTASTIASAAALTGNPLFAAAALGINILDAFWD